MKSAFIVALLTISRVAAVAQNRTNDAPTNTSCPELNHAAIRQAANGHLAEAEALVPAATDSGDQRSQNACRGQVLSNLAGMMSVSGRIAEAERLAEQSVRILERSNSPNDRALLRPLQILAFARLESGETARAREAF